MKKVLLFLLLSTFGVSTMAQQSIQLRSADKAECVKSDMTSLKASFSFSTIEAQDYESERGTFSWLSLANTVIGGNEGDPQIPVVNELIAVPYGANPRIEITSYSTTDYRLEDLGMHTLVPRQPSVRKDQRPEDVPFIMNEAAYQTRGLRSEPTAVVSVAGTMRGVQLGTMTIEPVSYDPVNNKIRVFNDIEVTVHFDGADTQATEDMLLRTYSPHFDNVYAQLFNNRAVTDVYDQHPDLYNTPVRMLVICYSGFQGNSALNEWLQWKLQKGYYVDIYYTGSGSNNAGTTASAIASFIKTKYNASVSAGNAYTYLIVIGDTGQVPQYMTKNIDSSIGNCASDLGYASVNFSSSTSNYFPDMYYSRMSVENTTHLTNYINKVLTYERCEFTDGGNYLNNVILVGGWDSNWTPKVAKPTINYATAYYFKSSNTTYGGFENGNIEATVSTSSTAGYDGTATGTGTTMGNGVYTSINSGVGFVNYTAHGDKQEWYQPKMTAAQVANLTNAGKYFFGVGNCCLTGNFNNTTTTYSPGSAIGTNACFAETMIRVPNAGAVAYVGCSPYSYWYEDFYWAVGAHSYSQGNYPSQSASSNGVYDIMFADQYWNSASALLYLGNLAVQQAVTNNNSNSGITDGNCNNSAHYYFQFYHTFGDGSVMPYVTKPEANTVSIPSTVTPGTTSITVNALAGSYVAVTDNSSVIYGVAEANASGVATVNFTQAIPATGTLHVVVTRQQYQPWFGTINIVGGTQYNITVTQPQHGTISAPAQAYATVTVTLEAIPETGYCLSGWDVRDANNQSITVTNNQFTMPESNVTVTATFIPGMAVTLASVMNGTISADPVYALQGNTINLTATPASGYAFGSWAVYKTGDVNTTVAVNGNSFTMPNYPVTVSAIFNQIVSGEVTIGSGTSTSQFIPTYNYYDYSLTQQIYTSAEVGEAGTITHIAFYVSANPDQRTIDIYMSHTSKSSFSSTSDWVSQGTSYRVVQSYQTFGQTGWNVIPLDTPFEYNGTDNLLITVDDNTNSWNSSKTSFYVYSTGANRAHYTYQDDTDFNPASINANSSYNQLLTTNNQIKLTKEMPSTQGYLSVSPTSLSGFEAISGISASDPQSIAVIGSNLQANLTVTAPTGFEVSTAQNGTYNGTLTLTPSNGSLRTNVFVRLSASASPGTYNGNLTLASGTTTATVSLGGTVTPGSGEQYTVSVTASPTDGGTVTGAGTYYENTTCTLTATPNEHYTFGGWQLNGAVVSTEPTYSFVVTSNADYTALFTPMPQYNVIVTQVEGGTISADPTTAYAGDMVTLNVTTQSGYYFVEWDVKDSNNQPVVVTNDEFVMPESHVTVTAVFAQGFVVTLAEATNGTISATQTNCVPGTTVTLTATPETGYVFDSWMVFKTGDVNTLVTVNGNSFTMPNHDVTVVGIFNAPQGNDVTIGSGTAENQNVPTYAAQNYSIAQQIYTSSELGDAGTITKVAFKVSNSNTATRNIDIYLSHTTKSVFSGRSDWVKQTTSYKVFSGSVTFAASGWTTITLDTPFEYNGTSNLLITVDDNTGTTVSSFPKFYVYSANNRALFKSNNTTNYDPSSMSGNGSRMNNVNQIVFTKAGNNGSTEMLSVAPDAMSDFTYAYGEGPSAAKAVTLVARVAEDITVTAPEHFEVSNAADGAYGGTLTFPVSSKGNRETLTYDFEDGWQGWTAIKGSTGTSTHNWMHNTEYVAYDSNGNQIVPECHNSSSGMMLSESYISASTSGGSGTAVYPDNYLVSPQIQLGGSITFYAASRMSNYPAEKFSVLVSESGNTNTSDFTHTELTVTLSDNSWNEYTVDLSAYSGMGYVAIRHYDCYDQHLLYVDDITIVEGEGQVTPPNPTNAELITANVYIRLKADLSQGTYANEELAVSSGDLSSNVSLSGEVTQPATVAQSVSLVQGWNWWTPTVETTLEDLEAALGTNGIIIKTQLDNVSYEDGEWFGDEMPLTPGQMYKIKVVADCSFTLSGVPASNVTVTINPGSNWFGYPGSQAMSITEALNGFTPAEGDVIKTATENTTFEDGEWLGDFETLQPGQGYVYVSRDTVQKTFTFPDN